MRNLISVIYLVNNVYVCLIKTKRKAIVFKNNTWSQYIFLFLFIKYKSYWAMCIIQQSFAYEIKEIQLFTFKNVTI